MARRPYCPIMEAFIGPLAKPGFRHNLLDQPTTTTISTNHTNEKTLDCNTTDTSWRFFVQGFSPFGRSSRPSIVPIASHKIGGQKKQFNRGCSSRIVLLGEDSAFIPTCHDFSSQDGPATPIQIPFSWQRCLYTGTLDSSETSFSKWWASLPTIRFWGNHVFYCTFFCDVFSFLGCLAQFSGFAKQKTNDVYKQAIGVRSVVITAARMRAARVTAAIMTLW